MTKLNKDFTMVANLPIKVDESTTIDYKTSRLHKKDLHIAAYIPTDFEIYHIIDTINIIDIKIQGLFEKYVGIVKRYNELSKMLKNCKKDEKLFRADANGFWLEDDLPTGYAGTSCLLLYLELIVDKHISGLFNYIISLIILPTDLSLKIATDVSVIMKNVGPEASYYWMYFVDLQLCFGHRYRGINWWKTTRMEAAKAWVQEPTPIELGKHYEEFMNKFTHQLDLYFNSVAYEKVDLKIDEFLHECSWATGGSGGSLGTKTLKFIIKNKDRRNTKWAYSLAKLKDLRKVMLDEESEICGLNDKEELGKVRVFMSAGPSSFLKMSYLDKLFEKPFKDHPNQTIFWSPQYRTSKWLEIIMLQNHNSYSFPGDLESFDQKCVTRDMVMLIMYKVVQIAKRYGNDDMLLVAKSMLKQYINGPILKFEENGIIHKIKVKKGMLSGWYWTAWFDSIISYCIGKIISTSDVISQGDDILMDVNRYEDVEHIFEQVEKYAIPLNKKKTFISTIPNKRTEYLRTVFTKTGMYGYPARALSSILWRKPWREEVKSKREKVEGVIAKWVVLNRRCQTMKFDRCVAECKRVLDSIGVNHLVLEISLKCGGLELIDSSYSYICHWKAETNEIVKGVPMNLTKDQLIDTPFFGYDLRYVKMFLNDKLLRMPILDKIPIINVNVIKVKYYVQLRPFRYIKYKSQDNIIDISIKSSELIESKNWKELAMLYVENESLSQVLSLLDRMSRSLWIDLVLGRISYTPPRKIVMKYNVEMFHRKLRELTSNVVNSVFSGLIMSRDRLIEYLRFLDSKAELIIVSNYEFSY